MTDDLRELLSTFGGELLEKAVAAAETKVLPGTIVQIVSDTNARVVIDGSTTAVETQNTAGSQLVPGARVLVLFFPPHGAVILGPVVANLAPGAPGGPPIGPPVGWQPLPATTQVNGSLYGDYLYIGYGAADGAGRVYFVEIAPGGAGTQTFLRLDPPYERWLTMWALAGFVGASNFMEVQGQGRAVVLMGGPNAGSGGTRYCGDHDTGEANQDYSNPDVHYHMGPWEPNPYQPLAFAANQPAWYTLLGGFAESGLQFFASAKDADERIWIVENLGYEGDGTGNVAGYLDSDGVEPVRVADLQTGATSLEGFSAAAGPAGVVYVAAPDDSSNNAWRYDSGPLVPPEVHEVQRVQIDPLFAPLFIIPPAIVNLDNEQIDPTENLAQTQAHYDHNLGAGVVVIGGTDGSDHTVTWVDHHARSLLVPSVIDPGVVVSSVQHGGGYPETDAWTVLPDLPGAPRWRPTLICDRMGRMYAIGGTDGLTSYGLVYRYLPATNAWEQLTGLPDGMVTNIANERQPAFLSPSGNVVVVGYSPDLVKTGVTVLDVNPYLSDFSPNPTVDTWSAPEYSGSNHLIGATAFTDGWLFVIGGYVDPANTTSYTTAAERIAIP